MDEFKKCDVCDSEITNACGAISNFRTIKRYRKYTQIPINCVCMRCAVSLKKSKKTVGIESVAWLRRIKELINKGTIPNDIDDMMQNARIIHDKTSSEIRRTIQMVHDLTEVLNVVSSTITEIDHAHGKYLWETYEERRKRSNYAISRYELRTMVFHRDGYKCKICSSSFMLSKLAFD